MLIQIGESFELEASWRGVSFLMAPFIGSIHFPGWGKRPVRDTWATVKANKVALKQWQAASRARWSNEAAEGCAEVKAT